MWHFLLFPQKNYENCHISITCGSIGPGISLWQYYLQSILPPYECNPIRLLLWENGCVPHLCHVSQLCVTVVYYPHHKPFPLPPPRRPPRFICQAQAFPAKGPDFRKGETNQKHCQRTLQWYFSSTSIHFFSWFVKMVCLFLQKTQRHVHRVTAQIFILWEEKRNPLCLPNWTPDFEEPLWFQYLLPIKSTFALPCVVSVSNRRVVKCSQ